MFEGLGVTFVSWHLGFLIWKWVHTMAVQAVTGGCIWKCPDYMFLVGRCCKQYCTQAGQKLGPQGGGKTLPFFILKPSTCAAPERVCLCYCDFPCGCQGERSLGRLLSGSAHHQRPGDAGQGLSHRSLLSPVCSAQCLAACRLPGDTTWGKMRGWTKQSLRSSWIRP